DGGRSDGGPAEGGRLVLFLVERAARHIRGAPPPVREGAVLRGRVDHIHARTRRPAPRIEGGRPDGAAGRHRALGDRRPCGLHLHRRTEVGGVLANTRGVIWEG